MPTTYNGTTGTLHIDFTGLTAAQATDLIESNLHAEGIHAIDVNGAETPIENLTGAQKMALFHTRVVRRYLAENRKSWKAQQASEAAKTTAETDVPLA